MSIRTKIRISKILVGALSLILVVILGGWTFFDSYYQKMNYAPEDSFILSDSEIDAINKEMQDGDATNSPDEDIESAENAILENLENNATEIAYDKDVFNILLIGTDNRENVAGDRSDSMILVSLNNKTLMSKVYSTLKENEIYYGENKKNINLLNGAIITSGQEFFKSLGMNFIKTDRTYQVGEKKGKSIERVNINTNADIPEKVLEFFKDSHEYLSNLVGKENVIYSAVHFDEDTPHMHFYFLPVVNEVKRKVFETDNDGKIIKKEITGKDGNKKLVPIVAKDENGNSIYKTEYGKYLNLDQFWKQKGGQTSYAKIQDEYNEFINSKGFNLYRGNVGANIEHQTKAEYELNEKKKEIKSLEKDINLYQKINEINLKTNQEILNIHQEEVLSPSKDVFKRYKDKDVVNLINYTKEVNKDNLAAKSTIKKQEIRIEKLNNEVNELKSGKTISEANKKIKQQEIPRQNFLN